MFDKQNWLRVTKIIENESKFEKKVLDSSKISFDCLKNTFKQLIFLFQYHFIDLMHF